MKVTDAVVAGGGPAGCAAALALVRNGAHVRLLEPQADRRGHFSGEWLHPAGVAALERLGVNLDGPRFIRNGGFFLHPGDAETPVELSYGAGTAVTAPHHLLVGHLQALLRDTAGAVLLRRRVLGASENGEVVTDAGRIVTGLIVGADGRSSAVRRAICPDAGPPVTLSHTAGLVLRGVSLPAEHRGHIFLGGPGPALAYRIGDDEVRLCLDVPLGRPGPARVGAYLERGYAPHLPGDLARSFRGQLREGNVQWSASRFLRRDFFGRGRVALVGDAAGHGHPLAAQGLTCALLDAECLGAHAGPAGYRRSRTLRSRTPERVAAAVHRVLTGTDPATLALRRSLLGLWRTDPQGRTRTMRLLGLQDHRRSALCRVVAGIAGDAVVSTLRSPGDDMLRLASTIAGLTGWLLWMSGSHVGLPPRRSARGVALFGPHV
ncbi:FAD-dependent monooxygenase [Streptomyces sp. NPDC049577]|uniref:FAD-dependent monooxygenase n=1 Tax=Streptomyces sp. NPDC049577 TaxID=3155153 RepID=UPI0034433BF6